MDLLYQYLSQYFHLDTVVQALAHQLLAVCHDLHQPVVEGTEFGESEFEGGFHEKLLKRGKDLYSLGIG